MRIIKSLIYYLFVAFLILYIFVVALTPERMMDIMGFRPFVVLSTSMEPTIMMNDMIISKEVNEDDLAIGDIITFRVYIEEVGGVTYVTHYIGDIIEIGDTTIYKTHGEGREDEQDIWRDSESHIIQITIEDIEGEYLFRVPYVGHLQGLLSNKVFIGVVILNVTIIYATVKYIRRKPEDEEE